MKQSIHNKLENLVFRHEELSGLLSEPDVISDNNRFRELSKEYSTLQPVVDRFQLYEKNLAAIKNASSLTQDSDDEIRELAKIELHELNQQQEILEQELLLALLPKDPDDERSIYLEIRAAAGGDESAIFSGDLFRMYCKYAEKQRWQVEIVGMSESEQGGYKEIIARISGTGVYGKLKFESGAHRVQRVPVTESQGRIHTSTCTVAIMPEAEEIDEIHINPNDLRVDTYRASGAGGQHVNKTDSAIRLTHIPTGIVVECQDERSQHKNRAKAMSLLNSKILLMEKNKQASEQAATRKSLVGTGDRSERIRTYNYPQGRVTDHRINLTLYQLTSMMEGEIDPIVDALIQEQYADDLAELTA